VRARTTAAVKQDTIFMQFNGDGAANYDRGNLLIANNTVNPQQALAIPQGAGDVGIIPGASATAGYFGSSDVLIPDYAAAIPHPYSGSASALAPNPAGVTLADLFVMLL